eukprot:1760807-Amphidinium_carterae.1
MVYNEQSARQRKKNTRSFTNLRQCEKLHLFTRTDIDVPVRQTAFHGTNQGECYENVVLPGFADTWQLALKLKKDLYGLKR